MRSGMFLGQLSQLLILFQSLLAFFMVVYVIRVVPGLP